MHFADAVTAFMAGYFSTCMRSNKTLAAYKLDLGQLQMHLGATASLASIESEGLERWARELVSAGYASVSIRRKFATARVFFTYWVRKGTIDKSPLWRIRLDLARERVLPRSLGPSDVKCMIENAWRNLMPGTATNKIPSDRHFLALRNVAALEILFATGMRVGELVKITLQDWREDEKSFLVHGKGSRQRLSFLPDDRSLKAVQLYLAQRKQLILSHDGLLVNATGGRISTQGIARIIGGNAKAAGVATRVTPHMIRHTVATLMLRYGADIRIVQEVLGHASIATTQRYTHVAKEHLVAVLQIRHPSHHLGVVWRTEAPLASVGPSIL
jgi:integrase/recombinase XerD